MENPDSITASRHARRNRRRICNVCGGGFISHPQMDDKRHNCLSIQGGVIGDLPQACWMQSAHPFAHDILQSVPSNSQASSSSVVAHHRRLALAQKMLEITQDGKWTDEKLEALLAQHRPREIEQFVARLPEQFTLRGYLCDSLESIRRQQAAKAGDLRQKRVTLKVELPPDFERGVTLFVEKTHRIADVKHQRGHRYTANTVLKRSQDARRFCEFLASRGLQHWPEVAQHHLDEYIDVTNRSAADRACTFLLLIRQHFRLTQRFIRPKQHRKPPSEAVLPIGEIPAVLRRLVASPDHQAVLGGLLLALFAQTPTRSAELTYGDFRKRDGKVEALFAEQWTPLDPLTTKYLLELAPDFDRTEPTFRDRRIFRYTGAFLGRRIRQVAEAPLRPLRLGAVANLMRSGITDRGALSRVLGVSMPTLAYVEKVFEWDLHMTVDPEMVKSRNEVIRGERTE
jgi:hypothetical protein